MIYTIPVDAKLTQGFGERPDYYRQYNQLGHCGLDYGAFAGDPIKAPADGVVVFEGVGRNGAEGFSSWMGDPAGMCIMIDHNEVYTGYAHLSRIVVRVGQSVKRGDLIGYVGSTGAAQGAHLHWEFIAKQPNFGNGYAGRINPSRFKIEEEDMAVKLNLEAARALAWGILGYKNVTGGKSALEGDIDDRLTKSLVGQELTNEFIVSLLNKESTKAHTVQLKKAYAQLTLLKDAGLNEELRKKVDSIYDLLTKEPEEEAES